MPKISLGKRIGVNFYNTGVVTRALSTQTFSEKGFGITPEQYLILDLLIENGELYQRQIAEITLKDRANVSRIVKILEDKGLINRIEAVNGRRIFKILPTEKGKELRDLIKPTTLEIRRIITENISEEELVTTLDTLQKVYDNVRGLVKLQI